jgi:glycosyltransferase involved in cell wall biosynthesis
MRLAGSRILFLNWRCPWHPLAGGAEEYCWNIATRFASAGAEVTLVTARPRGLPGEEVRSGVRIRRRGGTWTVYLWTALFLVRNRQLFSAVIDCQNGIPFFAPLFVDKSVPVVLVIHHVHQDQFALHFNWLVSSLGRILESRISRLVYGHGSIVAVSPATRAEVRQRLKLKGPIYLVPNGITLPASADAASRSASPSVIYLGRLVAHKRLHALLEAVAALHERWPDLTVDIAGAGPSRGELEQLNERLGLQDVVRFLGWVADDERGRLLASAWMLVNPSVGEGWGLTVIEANAVGRPALACRVPGLVNSIAHGVNGWLVEDLNSMTSALDTALKTLSDEAERARFELRCRRWAAQFSWDRTAQRMAHLVLVSRQESPALIARHRPRDISDAATVVVLQATAGLDRLYEKLTPSDLWRVEGTTLRILLQGHDTTSAVSLLEQLGLSGSARVRVARNSDLLFGLDGSESN